MLSPRAHEKNIEIGATVAIEVPERMLFDAARLRQVLFNVVGNAVKFTEKGGVFVSVDIENGSVRIRIDDSGPGMSADELARVFEEFEQAGDDAQRAKGTGLGLAISRRIMEAFGGSLTAASMSGKGSRFEIRFPMAGAGLSGVPVRRGILAGAQVLVMAPEGPLLGRACRHDRDSGRYVPSGFDTCRRGTGRRRRARQSAAADGCHRRSPPCGAVSRASCSRAGDRRPAFAQNLSHQPRGAHKPSGEPARRL
ncbi:ATP-binding protein [Sinorhizobium meliloti]|nr:ATP-binding protein [Sinorhizobium meliloti]